MRCTCLKSKLLFTAPGGPTVLEPPLKLRQTGNVVVPDTLGVNLDYKDSAMGAVIKEVRPTGLVATWNSKDSSKAMVTGDRILEVGGKSYKGSALIEALKTVPKDAELKLTVLKY
ncbi:PDZ domain-containing protein [Durusdinium trenchii]|uniref:PDZ domain-containing protein n=1 Tax=Durusdinium trenchii TaxID=1381693 RepID=A0ABP0QDE9_9DINO